MKTIDLECLGYKVKGDIYEGASDGPLLLSLIGRTSNRTKRQYREFMPKLAKELGITSVVFDYSGHGNSPFNLDEVYPAQHFVEVISVFDWLTEKHPNRKLFVIGSSYGGYQATQLTKYREFDGLILRAPAIYRPKDFYYKGRTEDMYNLTKHLRSNKKELAKHPLLQRASKFKGESLVIVHENDEWIPRETTDAYAETFGAEKVIAKGFDHSLDAATDDQIKTYNETIYNWLKKRI